MVVRTHKVVTGVCVSTLAALIVLAACSPTPQPLAVEAGSVPGQPAVGGTTDVAIEQPPTTLSAAIRIRAAKQQLATSIGDGRAPVSLAFAGDTSFHNSLHLYSPLEQVTPWLSRPDFTILNLETAIASPEIGVPPVQKRFLFRSDPAMVDQLVDAGVDAVSMANNHALDFGPSALEEGLGLLNAAGIETVGGGVDAEAAYKPLIRTVGDWTIGIAAFSRVPCDWSWNGEKVRPQVAWACPAFMAEADAVVSALVEDVDLAIVMVHGGTEGQLCADATMTALNSHWADLGAGLVVNSHPHVVQGVSSVGETIILNSTGNFAFPPSFGLTANSALFLATLSEQGLFITVEPMVSEAGLVRSGTPQRRSSILAQIDAYSDGWRVLSDGRVLQDNSWNGLCSAEVTDQ